MSETRAARPGGVRAPSSREDEIEFSRIVAFSDGVFAIAITLLVLTLEVPAGSEDLGQQLRDRSDELFAYALSFAVLGKLWLSHHRFFGALARFDGVLLALNLVYLAVVALVPFTSDMLGNYSEDSVAVIAYAINLAAVSFSFTAQERYAARRELYRDWARSYVERRWLADLAIGGVFIVSIPVALLSPTVATLTWLAIFLVAGRILDPKRRGRPA